MAKPLTSDERQRIADELRAGKSVREVSKLTGRSWGSVGNVAKASGIDLGRPETKKATEAIQVRTRAQLATNAEKLAAAASRLIDGLFTVLPEEPTPYQKAQTMVAVGIAMQRSHEVVGSEVDAAALAVVDAWLRDVVED